MNLRVTFTVAVLLAVCSGPSLALTLAQDGKAMVDVVTPDQPSITEQTAATELADYLGKMVGDQFTVRAESAAAGKPGAVYIGATRYAAGKGINTGELDEEQWIIRSSGSDLILAGGGHRGTLYATYRFLEETLGVHWWTPWDEDVPSTPTIAPGDLDLTGKPVIRYRDIYMMYGHDGGRCAARNRLNRDGDARITKQYGGCMDYGPPYHVHTFYLYFPPSQYFDQHPEWFSLINGKRDIDRKQLCLTNQELRDAFVAKLRSYIKTTRAKAEQEDIPPPVVFEISQNDWGGACQCDNCQAIAEAEESEAGTLIDFLNYISDAIKDDYPDVYIGTLAYQYTQKPPKTIRPRDNIIFRLCDTTSNFTKAITDPANQRFHDFLLEWANISKNLRIWDYAVTYAPPRGLPFPSVHTYQADYQFYAEHNVEGVFTEHEYPVIGDMHDLKAWMMMKLLEDPYRDYDELLTTFTDGFYGAAGPYVREYLSKLEASCDARGSHISMGPGPSAFSFVDMDLAREGSRIFDEAERKLQQSGADADMFLRLRHARLSLDRAILVRYRDLVKDWVAEGNSPESTPIDRAEVASRAGETWLAIIDQRIPEGQRPEMKQDAETELTRYTTLPAHVSLPEQFKGLPPGAVFDFTADVTRNWNNIVKVVKDEEAETGITNRLQFPTDIDPDKQPLEKYKLPMPWGLYDQANNKFSTSSSIKAEDVPGPGYHWYKMGPHRIVPSHYLYFFWSWIIQVDIDSVVRPENPEQTFDVWARIKFEGPAFPHGKAGDKNAICVERAILVKSDAK